jgi:hypothetical protein
MGISASNGIPIGGLKLLRCGVNGFTRPVGSQLETSRNLSVQSKLAESGHYGEAT